PLPRTVHSMGHTTVSTASGRAKHRLYVFGGGSAGDQPVDDEAVYCLDLDSLMWIQVTAASDTGPSKRLGHSITTVGSKLFIFGGSCGGDTLGDLWVFDTASNTWSSPQTLGPRPPPRTGHTGTALGSKICFFGGMAFRPTPRVFEDVWVLDTETLTWHSPETLVTPSGSPGPRLDHDACAVPRLVSGAEESDDHDVVLVFGGMDLSGMHNAAWELAFA
ncbi:hypothetical protein BDK51DRAFT_15734, partial [Blyttiomyces helicus]